MNQELYNKISSWIDAHHADMVKDIFRLVRIPSISEPNSKIAPYGQACRDVLEEMLAIGKEHGFQTRNYDNRCGGLWLDGDESDVSESIGFWGHLDVVPTGDHWQFSPFEPFEKDGFLVGRGVEDLSLIHISTVCYGQMTDCCLLPTITMKHFWKLSRGGCVQ